MDLTHPSDESKVLIIYTGGTIGMLVGPHGYRNEPHFLTETLRCQSRFHDPFEDSLFSHSGSVEGYRRWSNSGRASPVADASASYAPTLSVRSTRPIGTPSTLSPDLSSQTSPNKVDVQCRKIAEDVYEGHLPSLVTPRASIHGQGGKRIRYAVLEWDPLLDSSNIDTNDWNRIATEIELNYPLFDAFVILHGTDTMAYTASALSFMLEDLGKTVILTGAQIPLSQLRNDAVDNLMCALSIAGQYIIPECCLFFNQCLFRGNRASKTSSYDLDAFSSPNFPALVDVGIDIVVNWNDVIRQTSLRRFRAHKAMNSHVATLRLFPGITASIIRAFLMPPVQGVVLETFGAGNAPQRPDLMAALREASDRGVIIVAITQCTKGSVSDAYETGRSLLQAGVVPGGDMTPECALAKLGYLLSKDEFSVEKIRELLRISLRGELTSPSKPVTKLSMMHSLDTIQDVLSQMVRLSAPNYARSSVSVVPDVMITPPTSGSDRVSDDAAAPWSWTAAEASNTEASLLPFLIHLAVARDDVEGVHFCIHFLDSERAGRTHGNDGIPAKSPSSGADAKLGFTRDIGSSTAGGIVNYVDPGSGHAPLHVAALNGSMQCLQILLEAGALVHLRDKLGHTALYYAARRSHAAIVNILVTAGANLGGSDLEGGYVELEVKKALSRGDERSLEIWRKAGADVSV